MPCILLLVHCLKKLKAKLGAVFKNCTPTLLYHTGDLSSTICCKTHQHCSLLTAVGLKCMHRGASLHLQGVALTLLQPHCIQTMCVLHCFHSTTPTQCRPAPSKHAQQKQIDQLSLPQFSFTLQQLGIARATPERAVMLEGRLQRAVLHQRCSKTLLEKGSLFPSLTLWE